jgi:putative sigma-54 modulation protein
MEIKITGRSLEITPAMRDYIQGKMGKLEEFFKNIQKAEMVLEATTIDNVDKRQIAEIRVWLAGHKNIEAKEGARDIYAAVDMVIDEAKRQILRHKEKVVNEHRRQAAKDKENFKNSLIEPEL